MALHPSRLALAFALALGTGLAGCQRATEPRRALHAVEEVEEPADPTDAAVHHHDHHGHPSNDHHDRPLHGVPRDPDDDPA